MTGRDELAKSGILLLILWIGIVAGVSNYASLNPQVQPAIVPESSTLPSWNPTVSCNAVLLTEEQFVGTVPNPTQPFPGAASNAIGADYSGGALRLAGNLPAGSNPTSWPYSKRSTNPPCHVALSNGTAVPTFVEIHNVVVGEVHLDECGSLFPGQCDRTFNVCDYTASQCLQQDQSLTANNYTTTMFQHHNEIDMVWNYSGLIPASQQQIREGMKVDLQGFVYWDFDHLNISYHSFSGWELHPLTAWRPAGSPSVVVSSSPSPAMAGQTITFSGNIVGGAPPYNGISWTFGDGSTSSCQTGSGQSCAVQHTYAVRGNYTLTALTSDSKGNTGTETLPVSILPFTPSFSWSPTNPAVGQVVSFNGTATSGSPPYSFNWDFGDGDTATGSIVGHVYVQPQFFTVRLSVTDALGNTGVRQSSIVVGSWNPRVNCSPVIVKITDITDNMTGSISLSNSIFSPGITSPVGTTKRWLTPGNALSGWVSPGPPCTVTNSHGTVGVFVEIDGVKRGSISTEDCVTSYDKVNGGTSNGGTCAGGSGTNCGSYCDSTFNLYDPSIVPTYSTSCTSATDPTCYGRIHTEIDHDWKAAHYCGAATACDNSTLATQSTSTSTLLDVQGFVYWDPGNLNQQWHSYNGWEIHPLTGWRIHRAPLTISISVSTPSPAPGQGDTFTAAASGGTGPYTYTWDFGDGTTTTGTASQVVHVYGSPGTRIVHLYVVDSLGASGVASKTVTVVAPLAVSFTFTTPDLAGAPVGFNGTATGGLAPYTFNWNFGDNSTATGQSPTHTFALAGTYTVRLTGTDSNGGTGTSTQLVTVTSSQPLAANFTYTQPLVTGQPSTFTATATGGASPYSYAWDFGDGGTATGNPVSHQYSVQGSYPVRLTVQDSVGHSASASTTVSVSQSDFSISTNPTSQSILAGVSSTSTITLTSLNGFAGVVALSTSSSPSGLSLSFSTANLTLSPGGTGSSALSISSNTVGSYTVTVKGVSGSLSHQGSISVSIVDFKVAASPTSISLNVGDTGNASITVAGVNGFNGNVTLASSATPPSGLTCTVSPVHVAAPSNSTLSCTASAGGSFTVTVTGSSGTQSHLAVLTFSVAQPDFTITASPTGETVNVSVSANSTITVAPVNGFTGTVTLTLSISPAGMSCTLNPTSMLLGASQPSTLSCSSATAATYNVAIIGTSGGLTHTATVTYTIQDFSITSPTNVATTVGTGGNSAITVAPVNGFTGTVALTLVMSPAGLTCTLTPSSIILGASQISTLSCSGATGSYTVNVTGSSSGLIHTTTVTYSVTDFTVTSSPTSVTTTAGTGMTSIITVAPVNGSSSTVALTSSVSPAGLKCTLTPGSIVLGASQTSTLSCSGPPGDYTVTVTGTSGSLSHSATVAYTVTDFTVTASPTSVTVNVGVAGTSTVTVVSVNGFAGNLTLTAAVSPTGLICSLAPASLALGASLNSTLSCSGSAGQYTVTVTGTSGSTSHSTTVFYTVQDFSVTASPTSTTVSAGATATSTITITPLAGFSGTVNLGSSVLPATLACSLTPSSIILGPSQTSTLSCAGPAGTYTVTVTGTSGSLSHSATVTVTVQDFTVSASPTAVSLEVGSTGRSAISVLSVDGFAQAVALSASVSPSTGLACTLSPSSLTGSGNSTLSCFPSTSGTFAVNATGTSGLLSHSATVSFMVVFPAPSPYAVIATYDGRVYKYYANGTNFFVGKPVGSALRQVAWKPDGSYALIVGDQGVMLTYDGSHLVRVSSSIVGTANLNTVAWRPDGSYALIAGANGLVFKYNGTAVTNIVDPLKNNLRSISWNPQGSSALLVGDKGTALLYQASGQITALPSGTGQPLFAVAWSPDGSYALAGGGNGVILKYVTSFRALNTTGITPAGKSVRFISFNPAGSMALLVGDSGLVVTYDGTRLASLPSGTTNNLYSVSWSAGTGYVVGQNGTLLSYSAGTVKKLPSGTTANLGSIAWKPT